MTTTTRTSSLRARWAGLLLAALVAVLAMVLPAGTASASGVPAAQTRVGAIHPTVSTVVGVAEHIAAGQRRSRAPSQLRLVSGHCVAAEAATVRPYEVGNANDLKARSVRGDDLQIHHVPQGQPAGQVIDGYVYSNGTAIALPTGEHQAIPNLKGAYTGTPFDLVARDLANLQTHTNTPQSAIEELSRLISGRYLGGS